jgi:solute carrier family 35 protein F5
VTYVNTSLFILPLFTILFSRLWRLWRSRRLSQISSLQSLLRHLDSHDPKADEEEEILRAAAVEDEFHGEDRLVGARYVRAVEKDPNAKLGLKATAKLSFEFCLLWVR